MFCSSFCECTLQSVEMKKNKNKKEQNSSEPDTERASKREGYSTNMYVSPHFKYPQKPQGLSISHSISYSICCRLTGFPFHPLITNIYLWAGHCQNEERVLGPGKGCNIPKHYFHYLIIRFSPPPAVNHNSKDYIFSLFSFFEK